MSDRAPLRAGLADSDWRVRKESARSVAELFPDPSVVEVLGEALAQVEDVGLRNAAIETFSYIASELRPAAAEFLVARLDDVPPTARKFVAASLGNLGPIALSGLLPLALDPDPMTALVAIEAITAAALGVPGSHAAVTPVFERVLREYTGMPVVGVLSGVASLELSLDEGCLLRTLDRAEYRDASVVALGYARGPRTPETLIGLLDAHDVGGSALLALAKRTLDEADRDHALARLRNSPRSVEHWLGAVARVREADAARPAAWLLRAGVFEALRARPDTDWLEGALEVEEALAAHGPLAVGPLVAFARSTSPAAAAWALELAADLAVSGSPLDRGAVCALAREWLKAEVAVRTALDVLARFGQTVDLDLLRHQLGQHGLDALVLEAIDAIAARDDLGRGGRVGPHEAARQRLASPHAEERARAFTHTLHLQADALYELATLALADEAEAVRLAAVRALASLRNTELALVAAESLEPLVDSPVDAVGGASVVVRACLIDDIGALARLDATLGSSPVASLVAMRTLVELPEATQAAARPALRRFLGHAEPEVVRDAIGPLVAADGRAALPWLRELARHPAWSVRHRVAGSLAALGAREDLERALLVETDALVRSELRRLLHEAP